MLKRPQPAVKISFWSIKVAFEIIKYIRGKNAPDMDEEN